jgi:hypothetical protein
MQANNSNGPHAPLYDTFIAQYAPFGPQPELAMSLSAQPIGPALMSPRSDGARLRLVADAGDVNGWFGEFVFRLEAFRAFENR